MIYVSVGVCKERDRERDRELRETERATGERTTIERGRDRERERERERELEERDSRERNERETELLERHRERGRELRELRERPGDRCLRSSPPSSPTGFSVVYNRIHRRFTVRSRERKECTATGRESKARTRKPSNLMGRNTPLHVITLPGVTCGKGRKSLERDRARAHHSCTPSA